MATIHDLTALEQAAAVRRRELSPVEITEHYLDRIDRLNETVGAYVTVTADLAREEAKRAEEHLSETDDLDTLPPLHGVPVPIKDLAMVAGIRTTFGSRVYDDFVPPVDDGIAILLRRAGAILIGKSNTPEFGLPCYTENDVAPLARTPWNLDLSAGGSSGGAAAAVAAGLAPIAHASDGAGSIRIPASVCGLVGLKPSRGRISNGPVLPDVTGLATHGPIARSVADAAALLDAMAKPWPGDTYWAPPLPAGETFLSHAQREPGRLRIARHLSPPIPDVEIHPDCQAAYDVATELLIELGHEVSDIDRPFGPEALPAFEVIWSVLANTTPVDPHRQDRLRPLTAWLRERGRSVTGPDYVNALATLQLLSRKLIAAASDYDAILTPTLAQLPAPVGSFSEGADPETDFARQKAFTPFTAVYNVTGLPAISLPLWWNSSGLPIGVMLAGRPASEATVISLSAQLERAHPWADRHPELW